MIKTSSFGKEKTYANLDVNQYKGFKKNRIRNRIRTPMFLNARSHGCPEVC